MNFGKSLSSSNSGDRVFQEKQALINEARIEEERFYNDHVVPLGLA